MLQCCTDKVHAAVTIHYFCSGVVGLISNGGSRRKVGVVVRVVEGVVEAVLREGEVYCKGDGDLVGVAGVQRCIKSGAGVEDG